VKEVSDAFLLQMAEVSAGLIGLFLVFAIPLILSLTLVVLEDGWSRVIFLLLCVALVAANIDTANQVKDVKRATGSSTLFINEIVGTVGVVILITVPWLLGGLDPTREDLTWAILVSFVTAFISILALVLSVLEVAKAERLAA
jgi:hypothetical protein